MNYIGADSLYALTPEGKLWRLAVGSRCMEWEEVPPPPQEKYRPLPRTDETPNYHTKPDPPVPTPEEDAQLMRTYSRYTDKQVLTTYVLEFEPQTSWEESFMVTMKAAHEKGWSVSLKQRLAMLRGLDKRKLLGFDDDEDVPF